MCAFAVGKVVSELPLILLLSACGQNGAPVFVKHGLMFLNSLRCQGGFLFWCISFFSLSLLVSLDHVDVELHVVDIADWVVCLVDRQLR